MIDAIRMINQWSSALQCFNMLHNSTDDLGRKVVTFVRASWTAWSGSLPSDMAAALKVATPGAGGAAGISRTPSRQ